MHFWSTPLCFGLRWLLAGSLEQTHRFASQGKRAASRGAVSIVISIVILAVTEKGRTVSVVKDIEAPQLFEEL